MGVLLCKPGNGAWAEYEQKGVCLPCPLEWPCMPCASPECVALCCQKSRECMCLSRTGWQVITRMPCVPGVSSMQFSRCGRYRYQLSSEADCLHTRSVAAGELLYAAPVGVFPRSMRMDAAGKLLLCAGGAANEALLFNAPDLTTARTINTRHPCIAADFWQEGLLLVCAAEGDDIQTVVCTLPYRALRPHKLLELPGPPAGCCVCPDGVSALVSTRAGLSRIDLRSGALLWNRPEWALCMRLECQGERVLVSDTLDGSVILMHLQQPWRQQVVTKHMDSQACFL